MTGMLKHGSRDPHVKLWQSLLRSQGCYNGRIDGFFGSQTTSGTRYFQMTHLDPDGVFLEVDGLVGPKTWWAGENPSGDAQRSHIQPRIPDGLPAARKKLLIVALQAHADGVCEQPDGSNWGGGVTKILEGEDPAIWDSYFIWWCWKVAFGQVLWGKRQEQCTAAWKVAKAQGMALTKKKYSPIPGDFFVMLYKNQHGNYTGSGHSGIILSVAPDNETFNTIEGNVGNRVKVGIRHLSQPCLVGFINPYGDDTEDITYDKVLLTGAATSSGFARGDF